MNQQTYVVIGGGAAGFFGAIICAQNHPQAKVILLEKNRQFLAKVRISGGGRCNVTHSCFDPALLIQNYPRGGKALRGPFNRFQPRDTIEWFASKGVLLKTEEDGRMFPTTNSSQTIIDCLLKAAKDSNIEFKTETEVTAIEKTPTGFLISINSSQPIECAEVLIATGGNRQSYAWAEAFGHTILPAVPSLFTFNVPTSPLLDLAGVSVDHVRVKILGTGLEQEGPILITHWGFSGPSILKLSAWGARLLHDRDYRAELSINWLPEMNREDLHQTLLSLRKTSASKGLGADCPFQLPRNLWKKLLMQAGLDEQMRWSLLPNKQLVQLEDLLVSNKYQIEGKTTFKQEFVTCGGIHLDEVNFKTMESRLCQGLYFAGEVLDIDGVTGGFNFQNAWTTGWIAGTSMGERRKLPNCHSLSE